MLDDDIVIHRPDMELQTVRPNFDEGLTLQVYRECLVKLGVNDRCWAWKTRRSNAGGRRMRRGFGMRGGGWSEHWSAAIDTFPALPHVVRR